MNSAKRIFKKHFAISLFLSVAIIVLLIKNFGNDDFCDVKLIDIISIIVGSIIVFYLSEYLTDERRRNDCIEHIITEIEASISDEENFKIGKSTLIKQTSCANRIKYLKDACFVDIAGEIQFIEEHFQEIRDIYSNHCESEEALKTVKPDIDRHRERIIDKCCKIRVGLYSDLLKKEQT